MVSTSDDLLSLPRSLESALANDPEPDASPGALQVDHQNGDAVPKVDPVSVHLAAVDEAILAHPNVHKGPELGAVLHFARQLLAYLDLVEGHDTTLEQRLVLLC